MNQLKFEFNYSEDQELRERLYPLFDKVFGIKVDTFKDFYSRGFWDLTYIPFTFFKENMAISNVSVFEMPIMINGDSYNVAGIQSVMTHPDHRGTGFMNSLMNRALEYIDGKYKISFLMTSNPEIYKKYGFRVIKEHFFVKEKLHLPKKIENNLVHLDIFNKGDLEKVQKAFKDNTPSSEIFYPLSYVHSFYLNMYNPILNKMVYYSPDLNVVLVFEIDENVLELYDIIGQELPTLDQICSVIPESFEKIHVYFNPDLFEEEFTPVEYEDSDYLMVRGDINLQKVFVKLPITAEF